MQILYYKYRNEKIAESVIEHWLTQLPDSKAAALRRQHFPHKQRLSLIGWQLLRLAWHSFGYDQFQLRDIHFPEHGKPSVTAPTDFNLSHSGDLVVCAVTKQGRIGIDVERHRSIEPQRFKRYFTTEELTEIGDDPVRFIATWTKKEAVIKASGIGLKGLRHVSTTGLMAQDENTTWYLHALPLDSEYEAHVAIDQAEARIDQLRLIRLEQLIAQ